MAASENDLLDQLSRSFDVVGQVISRIGSEQWTAPTPCTVWSVSRVVGHVVGMNRVFAAMLADESPPLRQSISDDELESAYRDSAAALLTAFSGSGVLERTYRSPLGAATGAERLQIRRYDLLAHGWDIARAIGHPVPFPDDAAEQALAFVRNQLTDDARPGRFAPVQLVSVDAPAIERLAAFLGRRPDWKP